MLDATDPYDFGDLAFGNVDDVALLLAPKKNTRLSVKQVADNHSPTWYHDIRTKALINLHFTDATHRRSIDILFRLADFAHEQYDGDLDGKELLHANFIRSASDLLTYTVESSLDSPNPIKAASLHRLFIQLIAIARRSLNPPMNLDQSRLMYGQLSALVDELVDSNKLDRSKRFRMTFGEEEVRLLIKALYDDPLHYDNAVQFHGVVLMVYHLALRPSSMFRTSDQMWFLSWNQVHISVHYMHGRISGVDVTIRVDHFKGYTYRQSLELVYTVRAMEDEQNRMFDLGAVLLGIGLRQGVFILDWDAISNPGLDPDKFPSRILVKEEFKSMPIFRSYNKRGLGLTAQTPLHDESARIQFLKLCQQAGLCGPNGQDTARTLYTLRRGAATRWISRFGMDMARKFMAHKFGSSTAADVYDDSMEALDIASSVPGENRQADVRHDTARPYGRADGPVNITPNMQEAILMDPELASSAKIIALLKFAVQHDDDFWKELHPFSKMPAKDTKSAEQLLVKFIASHKRRYRQLCGELEKKATEAAHSVILNEAETITAERVRKNRESVDELPAQLIQRMQESKERLLLQSQGLLALSESTEPSGSNEMSEQLSSSLSELTEPVQVHLEIAPMGSVTMSNVFNEEFSPELATEMRRPEATLGATRSIESVGMERPGATSGATRSIESVNVSADYLEFLASMQKQMLVLCDLCTQDETITGPNKLKVYDAYNLKRHQKGKDHTDLFVKLSRWIGLTYDRDYSLAEAGNRSHCPLCAKKGLVKMAMMARHMLKEHADTIPPHLIPGQSSGNVVEPSGNGVTLQQIMEKWTGMPDDNSKRTQIQALGMTTKVQMLEVIDMCAAVMEEVMEGFDFSNIEL